MGWRIRRRVAAQLCAAAALALAPAPMVCLAASPPAATAAVTVADAINTELRAPLGKDLLPFYANRDYRPLWVTPDGLLDPAAKTLLELVETARIDGLDPGALGGAALAAALGRVDGDRSVASLANVELVLSRTFYRYVTALRKAPLVSMVYEHETLKPWLPTIADALRELAQTPSLTSYVAEMRWMHPLYAPLRWAALAADTDGTGTRRVVLKNLERIRDLPAAPPGGRHVLVDAASARLWMYENGRPVDSMKVVVGRPTDQTPMLAGYIRYAIVNPYWNVPEELVRKNIAPNAARKGGMAYLRSRGYEVLSDWGSAPEVIDASTVDWPAVVRGELTPRVRQLPNPGNAMGKVKFEFPNQLGIYLHDTPEKALMLKDERQFSSGCVRLEDADRLGRWLFQGAAPTGSEEEPEQRIDLPKLVPVYVTYLTARVADGRIALSADPYDYDTSPAAAFVHARSAQVPGTRRFGGQDTN